MSSWSHPDGSRVHGERWAGVGGTIVVAGAMGVPARYYRPLATWLRQRTGASVVVFDYRGVGASRVEPLRQCAVTLRDWADDLALVVRAEAMGGPVVVVGHSFGGMAYGMTDAHEVTEGLYTFATGAGWHGWMPPAEARRVRTLWWVVAPPLVAWHGLLPMEQLGMGEDLPAGVFHDWRRWSSWPRGFFDDPEATFTRHFRAVRAPVVAVNSVDDDWAPPVSAESLISHYPHASLRTVTPAQAGVSSIGHLAYVRPQCRALWEPLGDWAEARLGAISPPLLHAA